MIEFRVPYKIDADGDYIVGCTMGSAFFEVQGHERMDWIKDGLKELYGDWLTENGIKANLQVNIEREHDGEYTLISALQFADEIDAMAFKLEWM